MVTDHNYRWRVCRVLFLVFHWILEWLWIYHFLALCNSFENLLKFGINNFSLEDARSEKCKCFNRLLPRVYALLQWLVGCMKTVVFLDFSQCPENHQHLVLNTVFLNFCISLPCSKQPENSGNSSFTKRLSEIQCHSTFPLGRTSYICGSRDSIVLLAVRVNLSLNWRFKEFNSL